MNTDIFNLKEAARFLKVTPEGLRRKTARGDIPAAKLGHRWYFFKDALVEHLRTLYANSAKTPQGETHRRIKLCHSANEVTYGGSVSVIKEGDYNKALGLPTR